jgi:ribosomal protein L37AE/L43A
MIKKLKREKLRLKLSSYCRRCGQTLTVEEINRKQFICNKCMTRHLYKSKNLR